MCHGTAIGGYMLIISSLLWYMHITVLHQCNCKLPNDVGLASIVLPAEQASGMHL